MSSVHCVVVWEWQCNGQWLPHTPGVTRTLERAHAKKLTRVVLADADPALKGHYVNLRTLTQCLDTSDGGSAECGVRRACYSVQSPAGRGARWEWARFVAPPLGGELNYEPLPMEVQCVLEEAWSAGGGDTVTFEGWVASLARMTARAAPSGALALLRRAPHPPYPRSLRPSPERHRPRIPQQHTGSSVHSLQSVQSLHSVHCVQQARAPPAPAPRGGARSASPRERKPGFRQILHNLNIFSHSNKQPIQIEAKHEEVAEEPRTDTECGSTRSGRRHSVDTVSTYLSHESKESLQQAAVGELLNCSTSSDDVFEMSPPLLSPCSMDSDLPDISTTDDSIVGALCAACRRPLAGAARCGHGAQPAGSMAWALQARALPQHPPCTGTILVTYNFQSGHQGPQDPVPGAPYYAVGFPRHTVLPDTTLGRQVLAALRGAWARGALFALRASRTTGRELVVAWRAPPPPAAPSHYAPPARPRALLAAALQRLAAL